MIGWPGYKGAGAGVVALLAALAGQGCASSPGATPRHGGAERVARRFDLVALDGTRVTSATTRGRSTLIIVIATYDIPSQYVAREAAAVVRAHRPRINGVGIVLEPPRNAPLVEAFGSLLALPFPLAMGDEYVRSQEGPFGGIPGVPTILVLDGEGREVWRSEGAASARDIEAALSTAEFGAGI